MLCNYTLYVNYYNMIGVSHRRWGARLTEKADRTMAEIEKLNSTNNPVFPDNNR